MTIMQIYHPYVFTDAGKRIEIALIHGTPRIGSYLEKLSDETYKVVGSNFDDNCVAGVCPVK